MSPSTSSLRLTLVASVLLFAACQHGRGGPEGTAAVQILAINDFHGNLEPPSDPVYTPDGPVEAGGAAYLAAHLARLRARWSGVVSAGDLIGASPLVSGLFHDEPAIEAMALMGLDINAVGNHELDEGPEELLRMKAGGCHPQDGCQGSQPFTGAPFTFLAANVIDGEGAPLFPPYEIRKLDGVEVAFIGLTTLKTPSYLPPGVSGQLEFLDEAETVNRLLPEIRGQGVEAIVVIVHEGGLAGGGPDGCEGLKGRIVDIAERLDPAVDGVISGHTHRAYNCKVAGKIVTSGGCFGRLVTDIRLEVDRASGHVVSASAKNVIVTRDVAPDPKVQALVERYVAKAAPHTQRVVGELRGKLTRRTSFAGESTLGNLIADAQLFATRAPDAGGAQVALMNSGGIRTDLEAGPVTYGALFGAQPFGNALVTVTLTGAELLALLEEQWGHGDSARLLQVSHNLGYTWRASAPVGAKIVPGSLMIDGAPVQPDTPYRVTVNAYLAERGILSRGADRVERLVDLEALEAFLQAHSPVAVPELARIRRVD